MPGSRKKVLWVDDEIEFLRSHIMFLETRGYSVIPVFSGDDAIDIIRESPRDFDIVLLDEQMPGKDGLTTLEEIKEFRPDLPVVMVTKSEEEQLMEDALGKKIDGYLTKPVNPSQILLVCKKLLDSKQIISSQIKQRFIRQYSENRTVLSTPLNTTGWIKMYEKLAQWDLELDRIDDEGLRQTHAGQKSDSNSEFSNFIQENYGQWVKGAGASPVLSVDVVEKYLKPLLETGKKVYFIVMSGMRLDQYLNIEMMLRKYFEVKRNYFFSVLPTSTIFSRNAMFAGAFPGQIIEQYPGLWANGEESEEFANRMEPQLLKKKLETLGFQYPGEPHYIRMETSLKPTELIQKINGHPDSPLTTLVVNFVELLTQSRSTSSVLQEIAPDESGIRLLTKSWFKHSSLLHVLQEISRQDCTVVITSDHGNVFCSRGTEVYTTPDLGPNLRYKFAENISADERRVVYLKDPGIYGLPQFTPETLCLIAKENYYFILPDKFEYYQKQYQNSFQHGGISLEEMVVPFGVYTPL